MKSIYFFIGMTLLSMATITTTSDCSKLRGRKSVKTAVVKKPSFASRSVLGAMIFGAGVYVGKCKPELVDQAVQKGQEFASSTYKYASESINAGMKKFQEYTQGSSTVTTENADKDSTDADDNKETEETATKSPETALINLQHKTTNPDDRQD